MHMKKYTKNDSSKRVTNFIRLVPDIPGVIAFYIYFPSLINPNAIANHMQSRAHLLSSLHLGQELFSGGVDGRVGETSLTVSPLIVDEKLKQIQQLNSVAYYSTSNIGKANSPLLRGKSIGN